MCVDYVLARYEQVIFYDKYRTHMVITNSTLAITRVCAQSVMSETKDETKRHEAFVSLLHLDKLMS